MNYAPTEFEVLQDVAALLDSLKPEQQRQIMAMLAERYGMKLTAQTTSSGSNHRPNFRRKTKPL